MFEHDGCPFDRRDIEAITDIGEGAGRGRPTVIGFQRTVQRAVFHVQGPAGHDDIWLYGGDRDTIYDVIATGVSASAHPWAETPDAATIRSLAVSGAPHSACSVTVIQSDRRRSPVPYA